MVSIGRAGSLVETDTSLVPRLGWLAEDSSPSGWVGGTLMSLLARSLKGCGRVLEWPHSVPHKGLAKFHLLIIPPCHPALRDMLEPGGVVCPYSKPSIAFLVFHQFLEVTQYEDFYVQGFLGHNNDVTIHKCNGGYILIYYWLGIGRIDNFMWPSH